MLKRVFPDRHHKSSSRKTATIGSDGNNSQQSPTKSSSSISGQVNCETSSVVNVFATTGIGEGATTATGFTPNSSANSSPLKSSIALISSRHSSSASASSSPVKSEDLRSEYPVGSTTTTAISELSKQKNISRSCSSTEFQSLKLESMSTAEDFKSVSKTISSNLEKDGMLTKQSSSIPSASGNDAPESTSLSTPSDEDAENDPTESLFKHQAKFFCQMKDYLLSQQSSLRQHLELLNATVASRKKKATARRQQRFLTSGHSVHLATKPKPEVVAPEIRGNNHDLDLMNEFHSCSSTEKSDDDIQVCPLCGVEIEDSENPAALEEHVASHWCSPDDPI